MPKHIYELTYEEWNEYYKKCNRECKGCAFRLGGCCLGDILTPDKTLEDIYYDDADWLAPDLEEFEGGKEEC